ncbi:ASCH domain-containing protein [Vibrio sp. DW001]|nr:ASCH domain-containing protein [Vibrio sp. DW001]WED26091.1 ASCH domain-containing protein [Vibrio sp. DW001]
MVLLNWDEVPVCIIETRSIKQIPFNQVSEYFAFAEGEGGG